MLNHWIIIINQRFLAIKRLPEHCIEYVKIVQWDKENPFDATLDGDDPQHVSWVFEKAQERANTYNIIGLSYRLVQGVLKNIIPAVASTNAIVAASCVTEVFKIATSCYQPYNNSMLFNDIDGIYTYIYESEKKDDCLNCSNVPITVTFDASDTVTLEQVIEFLCKDAAFQMKNPGNSIIIQALQKTGSATSILYKDNWCSPSRQFSCRFDYRNWWQEQNAVYVDREKYRRENKAQFEAHIGRTEDCQQSGAGGYRSNQTKSVDHSYQVQ